MPRTCENTRAKGCLKPLPCADPGAQGYEDSKLAVFGANRGVGRRRRGERSKSEAGKHNGRGRGWPKNAPDQAPAQRLHRQDGKSWGTEKMRAFRCPARKDGGEAVRSREAAAERQG